MRIGYYDVETGAGEATQASIITSIGQNALLLDNLQVGDTQRAGVLFLQNDAGGGYTAEFSASVSNLISFVGAGGVAVFHDAATAAADATLAAFGVTALATYDPTGADSQDINFAGNFTPLTQGLSGTLDDTSLDGGLPSDNGFIGIDSVQDQEVAFLAVRADAGQGVTMLASVGAGYAIYSTIGLGAFVEDSTPLNLAMQTYAGNVLRYATRLEKMTDVQLSGAANLFTASDPGQDVFGGAGDDDLTITGKRAMAHGGDGDDLITISAHADLAWGGTGNDTVFGGHADDQLWGGADADKLKGSQGEDFLVGGSGTDVLIGGEGADSLFGGDGDDTLRAGLGTDYHDGGLGADRFIFTSDGVGIGPPPNSPVAGIGAASDYVAHFDIAAGDVIDLRAFGQMNFSGVAYTGFFPEFIIENNAAGIDRILIDLDRNGATDFEIHVEDADGVLTSADIDWIPYPT